MSAGAIPLEQMLAEAAALQRAKSSLVTAVTHKDPAVAAEAEREYKAAMVELYDFEHARQLAKQGRLS